MPCDVDVVVVVVVVDDRANRPRMADLLDDIITTIAVVVDVDK